jgi:hypothetical protein
VASPTLNPLRCSARCNARSVLRFHRRTDALLHFVYVSFALITMGGVAMSLSPNGEVISERSLSHKWMTASAAKQEDSQHLRIDASSNRDKILDLQMIEIGGFLRNQ